MAFKYLVYKGILNNLLTSLCSENFSKIAFEFVNKNLIAPNRIFNSFAASNQIKTIVYHYCPGKV